jgi:hypothetical protein
METTMQTQLELFPNLPTVRDPMTYWARYKRYLKSAAWRVIAEETKRLAGYKCEREFCTSGPNAVLDAHHRNYFNVFRERPGIDTMCICRDCHRYLHAHPKILQAANDNFKLWETG